MYMDNFYTLPQLFRDLRANGCGVCGTLRMNRCGLPPSIKENMRKGERKAVRLDKLLLAIWWIDKPTVTVLATIHDNSVVTVEWRSRHVAGRQESIQKPLVVAEYNKQLLVVGLPLFEIQRVSMAHQSLPESPTSGKPQEKIQRCSG